MAGSAPTPPITTPHLHHFMAFTSPCYGVHLIDLRRSLHRVNRIFSPGEPHFPHALSCPRNSPMGENHINDGKWYHFSRGGYNGPRFNLRPSAAPREKTAPNICRRDNCKPMGGIFVHVEQIKHVKIFYMSYMFYMDIQKRFCNWFSRRTASPPIWRIISAIILDLAEMLEPSCRNILMLSLKRVHDVAKYVQWNCRGIIRKQRPAVLRQPDFRRIT